MSWGFNKSELRKQQWEAGFYAQVMELLKHISESDEDVTGISSRQAKHLSEYLYRYARVNGDDIENPSSKMTVYVSLFANEFCDLERLIGYAEGGGVDGWYWPDCDDKGHWQAVVEKSRKYFEERRKAAEAAEQEAARKRALREEQLRQKQEREDVLLQRICEYVADCEQKGIKIVKKSLVDEEFSYNIVSKVWKRFDEERRTSGV